MHWIPFRNCQANVLQVLVAAVTGGCLWMGLDGGQFGLSQRAERPALSAGQTTVSQESLPEWVEKDHWQQGDTEMIVLRTEGFLLKEHTTMALVHLVEKKVSEEIDLLVHSGASELVRLPESYVEDHLVEEELILDSHQLDPLFRGRQKYYGFAKLHFPVSFREMVDQRYQRNFRIGRLMWTGVAAASTLGWLTVLWGYLKLDLMTRHFYSRRLQSIAIVLAIVILVVAVWTLFLVDPFWHDSLG